MNNYTGMIMKSQYYATARDPCQPFPKCNNKLRKSVSVEISLLVGSIMDLLDKYSR